MKSLTAGLVGFPRRRFRVRCLALLPAFILSLAAQPLPLEVEKGLFIDWPLVWPDTGEESIVLWTSDLENGPWIPCLEPIVRGPGYCRVAAPTMDVASFFGLAPGTWFMDDFDDEVLDGGWSLYFFSPEFENNVTLDPAGGTLRVSGNCGSCTDRSVYFVREGVLTADHAASIDLLDWDDSVSNRQNIFLVARAEPGVITAETSHYVGGVSPRFSENPELSVLWMGTLIDGEFNYTGDWQPIPKILPSHDYRLVFSLVDNTGTLKLYNLADRDAPLHTVVREYTDPFPVSSGWAGFAVTENYPTPGTLDVTLDNFVLGGTNP